MLTLQQARDLVMAEINQPDPSSPEDPDPETSDIVVLDDETIERPWGWVFFYNIRRGAETGEFMDGLIGNAPYIVNRHDGSLHLTGTAHEIEYYIDCYETELEEQEGRWILLVHDDPSGSAVVLKGLRAALGLTLEETARLRERLPGVLDRGARARLAPLCEALAAAGVAAELVLSSDPTAARYQRSWY